MFYFSTQYVVFKWTGSGYALILYIQYKFCILKVFYCHY